MSEQEKAAVEKFLREKGVTKCPPAVAQGANTSKLLKKTVARRRRELKKAKA